MIDDLIDEYLACAEAAAVVDYSDKKSVRRYNKMSDRMRAIVDEVAGLGQNAVSKFAAVLDKQPGATWAAFHLVEKANLDAATLSRCFALVEQSIAAAEAKGLSGDAMGMRMWLNDWKAKKS